MGQKFGPNETTECADGKPQSLCATGNAQEAAKQEIKTFQKNKNNNFEASMHVEELKVRVNPRND